MEDKSKQKDQPVKSSSLDVTLRVIGFIADITAIGSVLLAMKLPNVGEVLPAFINPSFAFGIWLLGSYLYLSYLHKYWKENAGKTLWAKRFLVFLVGEFIIKFRRPFLLLPGFIWLLVLIAIFMTVGVPTAIQVGALIALILALLSSPGWGPYFYKFFIEPLNKTENFDALNNVRITIDTKWKKLKPSIKKKIIGLGSYRWLTINQFKEIMLTEALTEEMMKYALVKYASENPDDLYFGNVYQRKTYSTIIVEANVLVNRPVFDNDKELISINYFYD